MGWLSALGAGALGAVGGFFLGGPIGAVAGFGIGVGAAAAGMSGNPSVGTWGGAIAGGLAGFAIGGPVGMVAGGVLGGLFGHAIGQAHSQQPQCPPYGPYFPGYGGGNYGMPWGGGCQMPFPYGMQQFPYPNPGQYGMGQYGGCWGPPPQQCPCYPPQQQQMCPDGGQLSQNGPGQPTTYTTSGGYKVNMNGSTVTITDPSGKNTVQEWGDPHENVNGRTTGDWKTPTRTLVLGDGTRVTMNAESAGSVVQSTSIYDGAREIQYNNQNNHVSSDGYNPYKTQYDARNQAAGDTAYFGQDQRGQMVFRNLFTQSPDLSVRRSEFDIATLNQPERQHRPWWPYWNAA